MNGVFPAPWSVRELEQAFIIEGGTVTENGIRLSRRRSILLENVRGAKVGAVRRWRNDA